MRVAWCSCNNPRDHPFQVGWMALAASQPDLLLLLGDNVYLEDGVHEILGPWKPATHMSDEAFARRLHSRYAMQFAVPEFRVALLHAKRVAGTVDDHDFLGNDFYVTPGAVNKAHIARALHRQFVEECGRKPLRAGYPPLPDWRALPDPGMDVGLGLAQSLDLGDVRVIVLDSRSFRTRPGSDGPALGAAQLGWLAQQLVGPQAVTIVASGSPLSAGTKPGIPGSPLDAYPREARLIRALYRGQAHQVVVHLGGDLHYNELWPENAAHTGFTEVASSGMGTGWVPFWPVINGNFGLADVDAFQVRVRTFGREADRRFDRVIQRPGLRAKSLPATDPPRRPDPAHFVQGDLLWPRADDQVVVYGTGERSVDEPVWRARRDAFVARIESDAGATVAQRELARRVAQWSYDDYLNFPPQDRVLDAQAPRVWVGHVGVVDMREDGPWVIDAIPSTGVAARRYGDWLAMRPRAHVWHGRMRELSRTQRADLTGAARDVVGRPYDFFNFDLDDSSGFYCSKLIWYAAWAACRIALDGRGPQRLFWYSPWQAMRSAHVEMLFTPGSYGSIPTAPEPPGAAGPAGQPSR